MAFRLSDLQVQEQTDTPKAMRLGDIVSFEPVTNDDGSQFDVSGFVEVSNEQRKQWENQGKIGFFEAARRVDKTEMIPFNPEGAAKSIGLLNSVNRLKVDDYIGKEGLRSQDLDKLNKFLFRLEEERIRGKSIGGQIATGVANLPGFMFEFLATGGAATLGKKAISAVVKSQVKKIVKSKLLKFTTRTAGGVAGGIARTAVMPHRVAEQFAERQVRSGLELTENGLKLSDEALEKPFISFAKAFGDIVIENFSEVTGPALGAATKRLIPKKFAEGLTKLYKKLNPNKNIDTLFTKAGYNGFLEELGEERVGALLRAVTGVEDFGAGDPSNMLDRIISSIPNGEEMLVEAGVLAFPGASKFSAGQAIDFIKKRKEANGEVTKEVGKDLTDEQVEQIAEIEEQVEEEEIPEEIAPEPTREEIQLDFLDKLDKEITEKGAVSEKFVRDQLDANIKREIEKFEKEEDKRISLKEQAELEISNIDATIKAIEETPEFAETGKVLFEGKTELLKGLKQDKKILQEKLKGLKPKKVVREESTVLKEKISSIQRGARLGRILTLEEVKESQKAITAEINKSDLPKAVKDTLRKQVVNINTEELLRERLPEIIERIEELESTQAAKDTKTRIKKILKEVKPKIVSGKPVGIVGPVIQKVTDNLRDLTKIKVSEARQRVEDNIEKFSSGDMPLETILENKLLGLIAGSVKGKEAEDLLEDIETLIATGRAVRALDEINRIEREDQFIADAIDVVTNGKGTPQPTTVPVEDFGAGFKGRIALIGKDNVSYVDLLRAISFLNKDQTLGVEGFDALDVLKEEISEKVGFQDTMKEVDGLYMETYGIKKNGDLARKIAEDSRVVTVGEFDNSVGERIVINMSVAEARKRWMEIQDPTLEETFIEGMKYTPEIIKGINDFLSTKDKEFASKELKFYRKYYKQVNSVYKRVYGVELPFNEFYSPIRREDIKGDERFSDLLQDIRGRSSTAPGSLKSRIANTKRIAEQNDYSVMQKHVRDMEHFMAFAEKIRFLRKVYSDTGFQNAVRERFGTKILKDINGFVEDFTRGSIKDVGNFETLEKWRQNFVSSVLMIKPSLTLKQLTSFPAFADSIPVGEFTKGLLHFWSDPVKHTKILMGTDFVRTRGKSFTRDLSLVASSSAVERFRKNPSWLNSLIVNMELAKQIGLKNIELGDKAAIIFGGWAVYRYHLNITGSHEKAIDEFTRVSNATQQSSLLSQQSKIQRGNFFHRLITMFKSTPNQYFRAELNAIKGLFYQKGSRRQHLKTLAIFHIILPTLFQWVSNGFDFDEDEQLRAAVLGSLNGWFLIGDGLDTLLRAAMGLKQWNNDDPMKMVGKDIGTIIKIIREDDITNEDFARATRALADVAGVATGLGFKQTIDMGSSFNDIKEGQYEAGAKKALGFSPFIVKQGLKDKGKGRFNKTRRQKRKGRF